MATKRETIVCDVRHLVAPDAACVDALARLQLAARRRGSEIRLSNTPPPLAELLELTGLRAVLRDR